MNFEPITYYKCTHCGRVYETEPLGCVCRRIIYLKGESVGSFIVIANVEGKPQYFTVRCILCGGLKDIHYTNLKRQVSCGCKPRHIDLVSVDENRIVYKCKRCKKGRYAIPPIAAYCCEDLIDDETIEIAEYE